MRNIIKALNYQTARDNFTVYVFLFGGIAMFLPFIMAASGGGDISGGAYTASNGESMALVLTLIILALATRICGYDLNDKTINYELMSGHSRKEVFAARLTASFLWCGTGGLILLLLPVITVTVIYGWGDNLSLTDALLHLLLALLPAARLICVSAAAAFLLRNSFAAAIIGYLALNLTFMASMIAESLFKADINSLFAMTNLIETLNMGGYYIGYINGEDVPIYKSALSGALMIRTAASSIGFGALALMAGFGVFRKSDIN